MFLGDMRPHSGTAEDSGLLTRSILSVVELFAMFQGNVVHLKHREPLA